MDAKLREAERTGDKLQIYRRLLQAGRISWDDINLSAQLGDAAAFELAGAPTRMGCYPSFCTNHFSKLLKEYGKAEEVAIWIAPRVDLREFIDTTSRKYDVNIHLARCLAFRQITEMLLTKMMSAP